MPTDGRVTVVGRLVAVPFPLALPAGTLLTDVGVDVADAGTLLAPAVTEAFGLLYGLSDALCLVIILPHGLSS